MRKNSISWDYGRISEGLFFLGINFVLGSKGHVLVSCLNPEHEDSNPSMSINIDGSGGVSPGVFKCWSCGYSGHIAEEFKQRGYDPSKQLTLFQENHIKISTIKARSAESNFQPNVPTEFNDINEHWRNMHPLFLKDVIQAKLWMHSTKDNGIVPRVWLPVFFGGLFYGSIARHILTDSPIKPKYYNSPKLPSEEILYPFDLLRRDEPLILVEGPIDALWLTYLGYNATSILGTENWSIHKLNHLISLNPASVIICTDQDSAGRKAANRIITDLQNYFDSNFIFNMELPENRDPADLDESYFSHVFANLPCKSYKAVYESSANLNEVTL